MLSRADLNAIRTIVREEIERTLATTRAAQPNIDARQRLG